MSKAGNNERLMKVIVSPIRTEKSHRLADSSRQITFKVLPGASKSEIRQAIKLLFEVDVISVQVLNCRGKAVRFGQGYGSQKNWKKAYVTLAEGQDIDFASGEPTA